jgi:hypothetical protein
MNAAWFDRMARRQALQRIGGGLAGGMLAALGIKQVTTAQGTEPLGPECRRCIAQFQGSCVSVCVRQFPGEQEFCENACFEGNFLTCSILGECVPPPA